MWPSTRLLDLFAIEHPIVQAPMAGASTPALAAAVANAGGLGSLGCAFCTPLSFAADVEATLALTNRSLHVNFFAHRPPVMDPDRARTAQAKLQPHYDRYGLGRVPVPEPTVHPFDEAMLDAVLAKRQQIVSFHFGLPEPDMVEAIKASGAVLLASATTPAEAVDLEARGVDAVIAQGAEAGGHNGFYLTQEPSQMGTFALVPQVVDAVSVPVIAAGGIGDGRGIAAAFALGADGVQIGTGFLLSDEAATTGVHRRALAASDGSNTVLTRAFSGRPARSLQNRLAEDLAPHEQDLPDFPLMVSVTGPLKAPELAAESGELISLWSGQAVALAETGAAAAIVQRLVDEAGAAFARLRP